eukprot:m51a1_g9249 putative sphingosine kinase 2-like (531) ;mRNA; r:12870-14842
MEPTAASTAGAGEANAVFVCPQADPHARLCLTVRPGCPDILLDCRPWLPLSCVVAVQEQPLQRGDCALRLHLLTPDPAGALPPTYEQRDLLLADGSPCSVPEWAEALRERVRDVNGDARQRAPVLVVVNPFSGKRHAACAWTESALPVFQAAGLRHEVFETTAAGDAKRRVSEIRLGEYSAVVCVGGDGTLCEVLNGLMERPDWERATSGGALPVCPVPGGTSNATVQSLYRSLDPACAACHAVRGRVRRVDMFLASQPSVRRYMWGMLSINCSIVSGVDFGSECLRFMGELRMAIWPVIKVLSLRAYKCKLSWLPTTMPRDRWWGHSCAARCPVCNPPSSNSSPPLDFVQDPESDAKQPQMAAKPVQVQPYPRQSISEEELSKCTKCLMSASEWSGNVPTKYDALFPEAANEAGWVTREFAQTFMAMNKQPWIDQKLMMAPYAHASDGCMDLCIMTAERSSRLKIAKVFKAMETGSHIKLDCLETHKARAFKFESLDRSEYIGVDGEHVPHAPLCVYVSRGLLPILCCV